MKLSIIIVSFNTKKLTLDSIRSIKKYPPSCSHEIVVVDNGSTDGSVEALQALGKDIVFIKNTVNKGFSKANNQGAHKAKGEYLLLLNSDTELRSSVLDSLISFAEQHTDAGVVAPKLLNPDKSTQPSIYRFPTLLRAISQYWLGKKNILDKYAPQGKAEQFVDAAVGAAFLITPKARERVGLLNEKYFMYFEDLDYCRAVKNAGLHVYYLPTISIIHHHGASGNKGVNQLLINSSKKYFGQLYYFIYTFVLWSGQKLNH